MSLKIREATEKDIPRIVEIWVAGAIHANGVEPTNAHTEHLAAQATETILSSNATARFWVADFGNVVVGWQSLLPCRPNPFFRHLHVESSTYTQRRSGVQDLGCKLLQTATRFADHSPIEMILGFVMESNTASIRMMRQSHFQKAGALPLAAESAASPRQIWFYDATAAKRHA